MNSTTTLASRSLKELRVLARQQGLKGYSRLRKEELLRVLTKANSNGQQALRAGIGYLAFDRNGKAILKPAFGFGARKAKKVYVSPAQIKRFGLRHGDFVEGQARPPKSGEKYHSLIKIDSINGLHPEAALSRDEFETLVPVYPQQQLLLETKPHILAPRFIDMLCPMGRGQRGLIISPPGAGATTLLKQIVKALTYNYSDVHVMVALIGERPEEITGVVRSVDAEVFSASFGSSAYKQVAAAELALARAQRLVEMRRDVVLVVDSLTRLTRAYNEIFTPSGHQMGPDLDAVAVYRARRFFSAGRNIENGGSLTLLATCTVDTGSKIDERIVEEFQHTANMELYLDKRLAAKRIFPALDLERSTIRHEEMLLDKETAKQVWLLRRMIAAIRKKQPDAEPMLLLRERLLHTRTNYEFISSLQA